MNTVDIHDEPEPCADMNDMRGWVKVTCEESDRLLETNLNKCVLSGLTDIDGEYGEPFVYREWGDGEGSPMVRDYRWPASDRECEHYAHVDRVHENGEVRQ